MMDRMVDLGHFPPLERAKRYRALAEEARLEAVKSTGDARPAFIRFAGREQLARGAEEDIEASKH